MRIVITYKKIILSLIVVLAIVGLSFGGVWAYKKWIQPKEIVWNEEELKLYLTTEQMKDDYGMAMKAEADILKNPADLNAYLRAGFSWKVLGESTGQEIFIDRSLSVYENAIKQFEMQYYMPYVNVGNIYKMRGDFEKTEEMYLKAMEIAPGEPDLYIRLVELYKYDLNKSEEKILSVYDEGFSKTVNALPLAVSKAAYFKFIGKNDEAIDLYQKIYQETQDEMYLWEIEDIKQNN